MVSKSSNNKISYDYLKYIIYLLNQIKNGEESEPNPTTDNENGTQEDNTTNGTSQDHEGELNDQENNVVEEDNEDNVETVDSNDNNDSNQQVEDESGEKSVWLLEMVFIILEIKTLNLIVSNLKIL